jgi:hypothetical protein
VLSFSYLPLLYLPSLSASDVVPVVDAVVKHVVNS